MSAEPYYDLDSYGEGYDCDDCGWSADDVTVREYWPEDGGDWEVHVESGCYSGWNEFFSTPHMAVAYLRSFDAYSPKLRAAMDRLADRLEAHLKEAAA